MAETRVNNTLSPTVWDNTFSEEFYQTNPFSAYAGTGRNNPIVMKEDFASQRGNGVTFEFITNLRRGTIFDRQPLRGHEDTLGEYGDRVYWRMRKKGVAMHEVDVDLAAIDLRQAARSVLKTWSIEDVKWEIIDRLGDVGPTCSVPYADSSAADRNVWVANNADRVLFGANQSGNYSSTFATAAANVDSTNDRMTRAFVSMLKRAALMSRPRITPIEVEARSNRRYFVAFAHPYACRDFRADSDALYSGVHVVERNEAIFLGGDREFDGVIVHEVDDMPIYAGIGNGGIPITPVYLLGKEALGWAIKQRYRTRDDEDDYDQEKGIGMFGKWGMKKLCYSNEFNVNASGVDQTVYGKQRGVVTGFVSAVGD